MRIISFDVGMKNLAYCIITIPDPPAETGHASSSSSSSSAPSTPNITNFNQQSLDNLLQNLQIERWDVIDLRFEPTATPPTPAEPAPKKTCDNDTKQAKFMYLASAGTMTPRLYCLKCADKSKYKIPSREILPLKRKPELLSKKKLDELMDIRKQFIAPATTDETSQPTAAVAVAVAAGIKLRKADIIQEIKTTLSRDYLEPFDEGKYLNYCASTSHEGTGGTAATAATAPPFKKPNYTYAHDLDLITYGRNLMKHLDILLSGIDGPIDMMIVENQISTLASRMKTLQGMITQYFIMKDVPMIEFISASCKLKLFTDSSLDISSFVDASTYSDRKKSGISICRSLGTGTGSSTPYATWMPMFEKHKKKDDLADCFLQGLWRVYLLTIV